MLFRSILSGIDFGVLNHVDLVCIYIGDINTQIGVTLSLTLGTLFSLWLLSLRPSLAVPWDLACDTHGDRSSSAFYVRYETQGSTRELRRAAIHGFHRRARNNAEIDLSGIIPPGKTCTQLICMCAYFLTLVSEP